MQTFDAFLTDFFAIYTTPHFKGSDFLTYLQAPMARGKGDEAPVVDNTIVGPLLNLLGFTAGEQTYNDGKAFGRPDFAPTVPDYGVCFVVEDKKTTEDLSLDLANPESHFAQLSGYVRALGLRAGWLTNGRRLMVWRFDNPEQPHCTIDLDLPSAVREWQAGGEPALNPAAGQSLRRLWQEFHRDTFADWQRLEREVAMEFADWERQALPVGNHPVNQENLVGAVKILLRDLQADARGLLDTRLAAYDLFAKRGEFVHDDDTEPAGERLKILRERADDELQRLAPLIGLEAEERAAILEDLRELQRNPLAFLNTKELLNKTLAAINAAKARKFAGNRRDAAAWTKWDNGLGTLGDALKNYGETAFAWHQHLAVLRHDNREAIEVRENYALWTSIVQETMLGGLGEAQRRDEFALQTAYVVFIRLLLIRVCEDKGILPNRFLSDGGMKRWQEDIERYFIFATGNPYDTLLDMAFQNAQNIYAHFFTGRELFNWYRLQRRPFIRVLYQLSRFNFADVDSDLIGTIYNTYVEREEKKQKGQYYTPTAIVRYILDETGYRTDAPIIGSQQRLIDPSCGSGKFLVEAARRLVAKYRDSGIANARQILKSVRDNLYGFDLNPFACYLAEVNLLIQTLDLVKLAIDGKTPPNLQRFHVYNVDALAPATGTVNFIRANTLMAEELDVVDRVKGRREEYATGFGYVVANPPYGASLTDAYKRDLQENYGAVFSGQPDTYVFFFALALRLLGANGKLGFITPNTYLMGTNTASLRNQLLTAGRITQIVDLPQGIWSDANVDTALLFLTADANPDSRKAQQTQVFSMGVKDGLDKLTARQWKETLTQSQAVWTEDAQSGFNIRSDSLMQQIEEACRLPASNGMTTKILRFGDVIQTSRGVEPYHSREQGKSGIFIKPQRELKEDERHWKPLLDSSSYIGRYELRWGEVRPHLNYGEWLYRAYKPVYYDSPKILLQDMRNRALKRRLVATYDVTGFYNRHNFSVILADDPAFNLKYLLALFNSSLLNYWYSRQFDNLHINPSYFRQLPVFPADSETQAAIVGQVDELLTQHAALNVLREQDYVIRTKRDGSRETLVPYDILLRELQAQDKNFPVLSLFNARAAGIFRVPADCNPAAQISRVFTPNKRPNTVVLRADQLWLEADDDPTRRYLLNYLARPQWKGRSFDEISDRALVPETPEAFAAFYAEEARLVAGITARLDAIAATDAALDARILDLYGITDPTDRARVLGEAPAAETEAAGEVAAADMATAAEQE